MAEQKIQLLQVQWLDHYSSQGWQDFPQTVEDYVATSVGYRVYEDDKYLVLAQTLATNAVADCMHIIKANIVKRRKVNDATGSKKVTRQTGNKPSVSAKQYSEVEQQLAGAL